MTDNSTDTDPSRRAVMVGAATVAAAATLQGTGTVAAATLPHAPMKGPKTMSTVTMKDGAKIYFKDWGAGPVITFSHGWPLSADAWDAQMMFFVAEGYRVIAHDRRGHGRSDQTDGGNDMDTYADDLATLLEKLEVKGVTMIGHSTGGGEVARYVGRHGVSRLSKAVLISAVPPHLGQSATNPQAAPLSVFDNLRNGLIADRPSFYKGLAMPFFGYNRPSAKVSQGQIDSLWLQGMMGGIKGHYDCVKAFSETDFTNDLKRMSIPTLLLQGDADQIVPIDLASRRSIKLLPKGTLKEIAGAPHGLCVTHAEQVNAELLAFIKA